MYAQLLSHVWLSVILWTVAHQTLLSMGFPRPRILECVAISLSKGSSLDPGIKLPTFAGSGEKQGDSRKTFTSASQTTLNKAFDCVDHNKLWKILKEMGIPDHLTCLLSDLYEGQEATVRTEYETTDWFKIGKEYIKAVYRHLAYLTYMQSTSCKMPG